MSPNNDGSANVDVKNNGKMKEVMEQPPSAAATQQRPTNVFSLQQSFDQQFHFDSQQQQPTEPNILDKFMSRPFTTFTALLTDIIEDSNVPTEKYMQDQIDQITKANSNELKNLLFDMYRRYNYNLVSTANQEAMKKLTEKDEELIQMKRKMFDLEQKVGQLNNKNEFLQTRIKDLEQSNTVHGSSFIDQNRVQPENLGPCRACFNTWVTAVICPCRHLCLCASCASIINACPVCKTPKLHSYEIVLP